MIWAKFGNKKIKFEQSLRLETNFGNEIKIVFDEEKELINRLIDLRILIGRGLKEYNGFVKYVFSPDLKNLYFYFKDEEEDPRVTLILDGLNIRCKNIKKVRNKFFKSKLFDLIREEYIILFYFKNNPNPMIRKKANSVLDFKFA